jgi:hypothetical protein
MSYPIIDCEPTKNGLWRFWCPYCKASHRHGGPPDANGMLGHRNAHCFQQTSPYFASGYILRAASMTRRHSRKD